MLKKIPSVITPELMKFLMEMGHGDESCLADGNFPVHSLGKRVCRLDGHGIEKLLQAILEYFPLDTSVKSSAFVMKADESGDDPIIWNRYRSLLQISNEKNMFVDFEKLERDTFYERAKRCYCIMATGETELYANIILRKGVVI